MADHSRSRRRGRINEAASPMLCVDETLGERQNVVDERKKKILETQYNRSPFLIGSIEEVNRRISKLDEKLQHYTQLVVESRASGTSSSMTDIVAYSDMVQDKHSTKEREIQEINQFAGVYAFKSTFFNKPNERMRNIQKITMAPGKPPAPKKDAVSGKPKFVELHQYPGYHTKEMTVLPHDCDTVTLLRKVAAAQPKADRMFTYKPVFERLFLSEMAQAMLQDIFWWVFLEKWQPNKQIQELLFNRVAHNYVKLLVYAKHPRYRYTFLRDFPNLLSQSVYAAYCDVFPDSYRQFGEEFKEYIISLVFEWVTGFPPAPRLWLQWNMDQLEPAGIKLREDMLKQGKGKKSTPASSVLSFLDLIDSSTAGHQQMGSQSTLNQAGSISSLSSVQGSKRVRLAMKRHSQVQIQDTSSEISQQRSQRSDQKSVDSRPSKLDVGFKGRRKTMDEALTPIHEFDEESRLTKGSVSGSPDAKVSTRSSQPSRPHRRESHPIGKGAEITKVTFDVNGRSPLVAHYLRTRNLEYDTGPLYQIQFSKVTNLPPLDSTTYRDLLQETYKSIHQLDKTVKKRYEQEMVEQTRFLRRQRHQQDELKAKQAMLLSKPAEVKQIADLIILGQKTDKDSFMGSAEAAVHAALMNQEVSPRQTTVHGL